MTVRFDKTRCDLNPFCPIAKICPTGALSIDRKTFRPAFDEAKCAGCGVCLQGCPHGAVYED